MPQKSHASAKQFLIQFNTIYNLASDVAYAFVISKMCFPHQLLSCTIAAVNSN